jgi:hypothetical protein
MPNAMPVTSRPSLSLSDRGKGFVNDPVVLPSQEVCGAYD